MYTLDQSKAVTMQITNDTFFYLKEEEEPLDETNLDEANEILEMFSNGFVIADNWEYVDDEPDTIQVTFIPYVEEQQDWDGYITSIGGWVSKFKIVDAKNAYIQICNENTGKTLNKQKAVIEYFFGKPWLCYPAESKARSMTPIWKKLTVINKEALKVIEGIKV